jgi:predicted esterase
MIKYSLIILISLNSYLLFGQDTFQIESVKTILKYSSESKFLVVLVHGSGRQDIEGKVSFQSNPECFHKNYANREFKLFDEVSDNLYKLGFSTLRYDKLSTRTSNDKDFIIKDFEEDLNLILQKVQRDTLLKDKKIMLFAWSEGVTVALNQLNYETDIAGMILYGGVFMDPIKMKADAYFYNYKICEGNEKKAKSYRYQFFHQMEQNGKEVDDTSEKRVVFIDTLYNEDNTKIIGVSKKTISYTKTYFKNFKMEVVNSIASLSNTETPLLIIHGDKDINVPVENHYSLKNEFENKEHITFKILSGSDHFMRKNFNDEINYNLFKFISKWKAEIKNE